MASPIDLSKYRAELRALLPASWVDHVGPGSLGIGHDVATTANTLSNPSALTVMEKQGSIFYQRLCLRWKDEDYRRRLALINLVVCDLLAAHKKIRRLVVDATSEKSFAGMLRDLLAARCAVEWYVASKGYDKNGKESTSKEERSQRWSGKQLMGDWYVQSFEDGVMKLPPGDWIYADHTLVKSAKGSYVYEEDSVGNHADAFVSGGLSLWALMSKAERVEVMASGPGGAARRDDGRIVQEPEARLVF